jgi:hypothetical protein
LNLSAVRAEDKPRDSYNLAQPANSTEIGKSRCTDFWCIHF